MKDSPASRCFGGVALLLFVLGILGSLVGGRIPFIRSEAVRSLAVHWIPALMGIGWVLTLIFHRDTRDKLCRRKIIELFSQYGPPKAILFTVGFGLVIYASFLLVGNTGLSKSAVFLSEMLSSTSVSIDVPLLGIRDFSSSTSALKWVKIDNEGHVTSFSYPASQLTFLPCANDRIRVSGSASWAGIRVNHVECSPQSTG